ncbi:tRNA (adenosine(37)-N6)-threonylcarbamoyltransferase complex ATPase subunit type 1 TsaE [Bacillus sp. FJAT-42376]|uniref:tRNA (adenosine(37)-N6)-threonylcarbamoyltransferase complex ATPase subunit type 1 TsaE n=1 Tax=Bacillus sp. FJAT-42376 TaxID=2014076 RepID=UPI000F4DDB45|nr:tRNA (adenosine(37)-N6)-threonylcarbamoyltransferase complex ATPase subunit type 1 TsaE [Bacillus sp. FJAT-42376]AZB41394.1 tRNA (adenosine(37)-N6)-threonylcarbamoyltransferase complex ATPase subunit type 1 TsaE [Bacillus sp. FJAT-42376]
MNAFERISPSAAHTQELSEQLALLLQGGDVLTLEGDLGAGKTTFTKGLAKGLGIKKIVNSPTFTIMKEYHGGRLSLYHMDVYRLDEESEALGFEEYFESGGVTVVEWAHLIQEQLPAERLEIGLFRSGDEERRIRFVPYGEKYTDLCKELFKNEKSISD